MISLLQTQERNLDQEELKKEINSQIFTIAEEVLNYSEMCIADPEIYKKYRGKVLSICNKVYRELEEFVDEE